MSKYINIQKLKTAFLYRYFSPLYIGASVLRIGLFIAFTGVIIQVKNLEGNKPFYEGLLGVGYNLPLFVLTPFTGVIADRFRRIKILRFMQIYYMVPTLVLIITTLTGMINYWILFSMTLVYGIGFSINIPAANALLKDIVNKPKDFSSAVGLYGITIRSAQVIGSGFGGIIAHFLNVLSCFIIDFFSHIFAFILFFFVNPTTQEIKTKKEHPLHDLKIGAIHTFKQYPIFITILFITLNGLFGWNYLFQLPIINSYYLHGSNLTLGIIMGVGALGGSLAGFYMSIRVNPFGHVKIMFRSILFTGLFLICFSLSRSVWLTTVFIFFLDFAIVLFMVTATAFVQLIAHNSIRGRVMGFFSMANFGLIPIGSFIFYGIIGGHIGLMNIIMISGIIYVIASIFYFTLMKKLKKRTFKILFSKKEIKKSEIDLI